MLKMDLKFHQYSEKCNKKKYPTLASFSRTFCSSFVMVRNHKMIPPQLHQMQYSTNFTAKIFLPFNEHMHLSL